MKTRRATRADSDAIAALHAASWRHAYRGALSDDFLAGDIVANRQAVWVNRLSSERNAPYVVVAELSDRIIGFACVFCDPVDPFGSLLDNIHVEPGSHRGGIGTTLIRDIGSWCLDAAPHSPIYLWVLKSNHQARAFYSRLGALESGEDVWTPPGGGAVPRFRLAWASPSLLLRRC